MAIIVGISGIKMLDTLIRYGRAMTILSKLFKIYNFCYFMLRHIHGVKLEVKKQRNCKFRVILIRYIIHIQICIYIYIYTYINGRPFKVLCRVYFKKVGYAFSIYELNMYLINSG